MMKERIARTKRTRVVLAVCGTLACLQPLRAGAILEANPSNYRALIWRLRPGDTLRLAAGTYRGLSIAGVNGTESAWITITGPADGPSAIITGGTEVTAEDTGRRDAIDITMSSYVSIENLRIDSRGVPGVFGIAAHGHVTDIVHHIRVEGNTFIGQGGNQQTDAISTKVPTWGWAVRYNRILGAGTGIYLGNSDGSDPFVDGIIENNLIRDTIGYNMEIKHQNGWPVVEGMPLVPTSTIIRNNVFIKNDLPSPDGDRPNLLVGSFPAVGPGSLNTYEIYGNVFLHNHREALLQASGRITVHDNLFVDGPYAYPAIVFRQHMGLPLQVAYFYNNTVYTPGSGVYFGSRATKYDAVVGNLIFAFKPISGQVMRQEGNISHALEDASLHVAAPSFDFSSMNFFPLPGKCVGSPLDLSAFDGDLAYTLDFNGRSKVRSGGAVIYRGAYAGSGENPGWRIEEGIKPPSPPNHEAEPVLVWVSSTSVAAGRSIEVKLTGANFTPDAAVSVSGKGITVIKASVLGPTAITATLSAAAIGVPGPREITVTQPSGRSNSFRLLLTSAKR